MGDWGFHPYKWRYFTLLINGRGPPCVKKQRGWFTVFVLGAFSFIPSTECPWDVFVYIYRNTYSFKKNT